VKNIYLITISKQRQKYADFYLRKFGFNHRQMHSNSITEYV